ncbi:oligosaccharide flippase family protein [Geomesophilobacter sediminis]|uniref:Polysaccharide biosynthesis protein n=1 Tax=Geomesophilobacter sediminis TaxID=2798584 RepID=A0A8J7M1B2_9BACT|nr:oligosaccharide flippase family protein [Geomesophilobacter sediminis]MBJ6726703.1 polysaccharide biosynthesis protein [Geomesophilobacter sediminis]
MSSLKKLARQTATYGLSSIVGRLINYFLVPLYTRIFLPQEYGIVTELYAYASFLMILLTFGMETTFFRFSESDHDKESVYATSLWPVVTVNLIFAAGGILSASYFSGKLHYGDHAEYIVYFVLILALDAITAIPFARLRQQHQALRFSTIKLVNIGINVLCNFFFLIFCPYLVRHGVQLPDALYHSTGRVGYVFLSNMIASAATLVILHRELCAVRPAFDRKLLKEMTWYTLPLLLAGLAGMVNETLDRILLRYLLVVPHGIADAGAYVMAQMGIYGANYKISILMTLFIQTFRYAAEPFFFAQAREHDSRHIYSQVMTYFIVFGLMIFLGATLYIDIIKHFVGRKYYSGLGIVPILLLANLCLGIIFNLSIWYKLNNKTRYGAYLTFFGATVTIAANFVLIPILGYAGAAWATFICYFLMMLLSYFWGQKHFYVEYETTKILGYVGFALGLFFLSRYWPFRSPLLLFAANSAAFLLFVGVAVYKEKLTRVLLPRKAA